MTKLLTTFEEKFLELTALACIKHKISIDCDIPNQRYVFNKVSKKVGADLVDTVKPETFQSIAEIKSALESNNILILDNLSNYNYFFSEWINDTVDLKPTWHELSKIYYTCWSEVSISQVVDCINAFDNTEYFLNLLELPIVATNNQERNLYILYDTIAAIYNKYVYEDLNFDTNQLLNSVKCCLTNYREVLEGEKNVVLEEQILSKLKQMLPEWLELVEYFPNLPQKKQSDKGLFTFTGKRMLEVTLSKEEIFNQYPRISTHTELNNSIDLVFEILAEQQPVGVGVIERIQKENTEYLTLFINESAPIHKVIQLIGNMLGDINGLENTVNLSAYKDMLSTSMQKHWLDINLLEKKDKKSKKKKI